MAMWNMSSIMALSVFDLLKTLVASQRLRINDAPESPLGEGWLDDLPAVFLAGVETGCVLEHVA
jgi:hypothetical protein